MVLLGMDVIDLVKFKEQRAAVALASPRNDDDDGKLHLTEYEEGTDMSDLLYLTVDGGVVILTAPEKGRGLHLTPEQAKELGSHLIQYAAVAAHADLLTKMS